MRSSVKIATKTISLLLVFSLAQLYVFAGGATTSNLLMGRLTTNDNFILLNGSNAATGATVLSGADIVTAENQTASVQLPTLGSLTISPNTHLTLSFNKGQVDVNVVAGSALLSTIDGVRGSVTADGKTDTTVGGTAGNPTPAPKLPPGTKGPIIGAFVLGGLAFFFGVWGLIKANHNRDCINQLGARNPSPFVAFQCT